MQSEDNLSSQNRKELPPVNGSWQQFQLQTGSEEINDTVFKEREPNFRTVEKVQRACTKLLQDAKTSKGLSTLNMVGILSNRFTAEEVIVALHLLECEDKVISNKTVTSSKEDRKDTWYRWKSQ